MRPPVVPILLVLALLAAASPAVAPGSSGPAFTVYAAPGGLGNSAGEPSLGVNPATGAAFLQAFTETLRVRFDDSVSPAAATWENVASAYTSVINVDPIAFTDQVTGRTFAGGLENACSLLAYTDDDGASWTPMADTCTAPAFDHPTIGSGPYHTPAPPTTAIYPHAVYYCTQGVVQECATSWDGGITFNPPVIISTVCTNAVGHVKVGVDGTAYVPAKNCGNTQAVMVSKDNGLTWATRRIAGSTVISGFNDPSVATTPSGGLYASWIGNDRHLRVALTQNDGVTWGPATDVSALVGVQTASFPAMVAGDDDRAAVAFLGTTDPGNGFAQPFQGTWDLYVALTYDAGATWTVTKATTDPVQRGWICISGTACDLGSAPTGRNLLDFMDATLDADGRVLVAFADGCVAACGESTGTRAMSTSAKASLARQACGPGLYADKGDVDGGAGCPTGVPPPPAPVVLSGTYYATGLTPLNNADGIARIAVPFGSLSPTAPGPTPPKAAAAGGQNHGSNAGTVWDAHWFLDAGGAPLRLEDATVTVHLTLAGATPGATLGPRLRVALYDGSSLGFAPINSALVAQTVTLAPGATQATVTFTGVTATLNSGLELYVDAVGGDEAVILYDSSLAPTRVEIG